MEQARDDGVRVEGIREPVSRIEGAHVEGSCAEGRANETQVAEALQAMLREAVEQSRALLRLLERLTEVVATQSGGDTAVAPTDPPDPSAIWLTPRERELLDHLARGDSNRQIATTLGISERTVKNHLHNIFTKLRVTDRASAVRKALPGGSVALTAGPEQ